jgi:hypothetical protein
MNDRSLTGTNDWKKCEIVLDVADEATCLYFGVTIFGTGTIWIDEVLLEEVSKDIPSTNMEALCVQTNKDLLQVWEEFQNPANRPSNTPTDPAKPDEF